MVALVFEHTATASPAVEQFPSLLGLVQQIASSRSPPVLALITLGTQAAEPTGFPAKLDAPSQAGVWGFARTLRLELPTVRTVLTWG